MEIKRNVALNAVITHGVDRQLAESIEHILAILDKGERERSNDGWSSLKLAVCRVLEVAY
jgi:hypothetical protein